MNQTHDISKSRHQRVFLPILIGLLILRIPFVAGMLFFHIQREWIVTVVNVGTYLLTAFLIWWEAENLAKYHIDTFAIVIIVLFNPIHTLISAYHEYHTPLAFPNFPSLLIWLIAIMFSMGMWHKRSKLPKVKPVALTWLILGIVAGLLTSILTSFPKSFEISSYEVSRGRSVENALARIPLALIYQIGYAAVLEEPLFRGFLWGYLRQLKWSEISIWLFQASLFTFSHFYYIKSEPIFFWIIAPVCALVLGFLVWRSRTIAMSMVAHGMMNATGYAFGYLVATLRLGY